MSGESATRVPFAAGYRGSGILLHATSLPSPYGVGDLGPTAISWIDRLEEAGQSWWQSLPLGPTGYDNSPYQPLSSFAGNALLISPQWLVEDELLTASDCEHPPFPEVSSIMARSFPSSTGYSKRRGSASERVLELTFVRSMRNFVTTTIRGCRTMLSSAHSRRNSGTSTTSNGRANWSSVSRQPSSRRVMSFLIKPEWRLSHSSFCSGRPND